VVCAETNQKWGKGRGWDGFTFVTHYSYKLSSVTGNMLPSFASISFPSTIGIVAFLRRFQRVDGTRIRNDFTQTQIQDALLIVEDFTELYDF